MKGIGKLNSTSPFQLQSCLPLTRLPSTLRPLLVFPFPCRPSIPNMTIQSHRRANHPHLHPEHPRNRAHPMGRRFYTCLSRRLKLNRETKPPEESFGDPSPQHAPESPEESPPPPYVPPLAGLGEGLRGNATTQPRQSTEECISLDTRRDRHPDPPPPCADHPVRPLLHERPLHSAAEAAATPNVIKVNSALDEQHPRMAAARIARAIALDVSTSRPSGAFPAAVTPAKRSTPLAIENPLDTAPRDQCECAHGHAIRTAASTSATADPGNLWPADIHSMRAPGHEPPQQLPSLPTQQQQPVMVFTRAWVAFTGSAYVVGALIAWMVRADMAWSVGAGTLWMVGFGVIWLMEDALSFQHQQWCLRYEQWRLSYEQWRLKYQQWHVQYQQQQQQ